MSPPSPSFVSLALRDRPAPDWADVVVESVPEGMLSAPADPACWANEVFAVGSAPPAVAALMALRQAVVPLIGITPAPRDVFEVARVEGDEALIVHDDRHLDFQAGVGFDPATRLLRVTTAVWLKGWRGRLYFAPVSVLHDPVTRSMMRRAIHRVVGPVPPSDTSVSGRCRA
ncbi:MAG: DUF2867 domain-containing protein [Actinomycetota bacterium]|nr:DUF2867 domain-containing protein [Actinomycetota bacterium]